MSFNPVAASAVVHVLGSLPDEPTVLEFGNQTFRLTEKIVNRLIDRAGQMGREIDTGRLRSLVHNPAGDGRPLTEDFYRALGFRRYAAIDVNSRYGSLVMDLNRDVVAEYGFEERFDLVTNNGTGEHIFDQRWVFQNAHNLTKPGGVMLHILPFVNWLNHGFYNFNPVMFADLAAANGYRILRLALANKLGYEVAVDLDATPAPRPAPAPANRLNTLVRSPSGRLAADEVRRFAQQTAARLRHAPRAAPELTLGDAVTHVVPSAETARHPLMVAVDDVMRNESAFTGSTGTVLGNVMIVAALQKQDDDPFRVPMAGRYVADIESDAVRASYAQQAGISGDPRPLDEPDRGTPGPPRSQEDS